MASNQQYRAGRRLEYEVVKLLRQDGWTAFRTAGSHGPADVIGLKWIFYDLPFLQPKWERYGFIPGSLWQYCYQRTTRVGAKQQLYTTLGKLETGQTILLVQCKQRQQRKKRP